MPFCDATLTAAKPKGSAYPAAPRTLGERLRRNRLDRGLLQREVACRLRVYLAPKVLVVDEFGVWFCDRATATALFSLVSARYERGSLILTSNKGFAERGDVLGDAVIATAILDRLLHDSHVLNIRGESYRLREKKPAGLFHAPPALAAEAGKKGRKLHD